MSALLPAAVYGLEVPSGDVMVPAVPDFPAAFRITMAAIDPSTEPEFSGTAIDGTTPRATLKLVRQAIDPDDEDDSDYDSEDDDSLQALLNGDLSDEDSSEDDEANGGPSDPSKSKKAKAAAAIDALKQALANGEDESMSDAEEAPSKKDKGKAIATGDEESSSEGDSESLEIEEFVICTLDPTSHYQQPLDIVVGEDEKVFFKVTGTHTIFLTGNYVIPVDDSPRPRRSEEDLARLDEMFGGGDPEYDLSPDEDELDEDDFDEDESEDELDDLADPRIKELDSDEEEEVPKLVKKGKNKRAAPESDDEPAGLDEIISKALKPEQTTEEPKLSKKQQKKLKNNAGQAVKADAKAEAKADGKTKTETESPGKKVQFAKNLEQGPTGSKVDVAGKTNGEKVSKPEGKGKLGVRMVKGVSVDDKKLGSGPAAKKGDKIAMRYIGKLKDGKQFDSNKKGKPFTFKLGAGEVISGWDIGIEGITAGGERRIIVPGNLAYGKKGVPGIPANAELTFDVKCLSIN